LFIDPHLFIFIIIHHFIMLRRSLIVCNKILNVKFKGDKYFVDEVETQLRENPLRGSQTQNIHYSKNEASNKAVTLIYP
jgi:hypothetical protein